MEHFDVAIIGGGFFGCNLALKFSQMGKSVVLIEREPVLLGKASYNNQARIHNGYHYPRSFLTAQRSHVNFQRFVKEFRPAVCDNFEKYYAIPRLNSKVNSYQFYEVFKQMGPFIKVARKNVKELFYGNMIEEVFQVEEFAFDASKMREIFTEKLVQARVRCIFESTINRVLDGKKLILESDEGSFSADEVFNCTYSGINVLLKNSGLSLLPLKHEIAEICLVEVPEVFKGLGVTIMDGPFFSLMPFPAENLHSFSHVRYTPHGSWVDQEKYRNSFEVMNEYPRESNYIFMKKDATRFSKYFNDLEYKKSLFEVKTLLTRNEVDDGRPILYRKNYGMRGFHIVLGGKLDNIYDILEYE